MINKTITIDGQTYTLRNIDFEAICDLEELGFQADSLAKKAFGTVRVLLAYAMNTDVDSAGKALQKEISANHNYLQLSETLYRWLTESDFFQSLQAEADEKKQ